MKRLKAGGSVKIRYAVIKTNSGCHMQYGTIKNRQNGI